MADREKVIQALESHILGMQCESCPHHDECDYTEEMPAVLGDALDLIKEQAERIKGLLECATILSDALDEKEERDG